MDTNTLSDPVMTDVPCLKKTVSQHTLFALCLSIADRSIAVVVVICFGIEWIQRRVYKTRVKSMKNVFVLFVWAAACTRQKTKQNTKIDIRQA